jgi:hypothetical protein
MNWLTILEMMNNAEAYETHFRAAIEQAISDGTPLKDRSVALLQKVKNEPIRSKVELRERIRNLRSPAATFSTVFRKIGSKVPEEKFKPMTYAPDADKWNIPTIRKHGSSKVKDRKQQIEPRPLLEEKKYQQKPPTIRHYVGLQSYHDAPAKLQRKVQLENRSPSGDIVEEFSAREAPRTASRSDWPAVEQLTRT